MSRGTRLWCIIACFLCLLTGTAVADESAETGSDVTAESQPTEGSAANQIGFRAADPDDHKENLSGIPYMAGAYVVFWVGLLLYLLSLRKRFAVVETELADLRKILAERDA